MQFVRELAGLPVAGIVESLARSDAPFGPSEVYRVVSADKIVDAEQRVSVFRRLHDAALFTQCEALVRAVSDADPLNTFTLLRNDLTHIVYEKNGFFTAHRDFLSVTSNVIEEYTLLLCVTPPGVVTTGGATRITVNPLLIIDSTATITPGGALLFRKDLCHEGLPVTAGEKHILSLNVWATRKASAGPILLITFPAEQASAPAAPAAPLQALADARSYAISLAQLAQHPTCILNTYAELKQQQQEADAAVLTYKLYECRACSYEEFGTVFRAIHGLYVRAADLVACSRALLFFGIGLQAVLVDTANVDNANGGADAAEAAQVLRLGLGERCCVVCSRAASQLPAGAALRSCDTCAQRVYCSDACYAADADHSATCVGAKASHADDDADDDDDDDPDEQSKEGVELSFEPLADEAIITCTSDERTRVVVDAAKALGLPYIRFRALFAEGTISYGGDMAVDTPEVQLDMQPVWVSVGDYDNVLVVRNLCHTGDQFEPLEKSLQKSLQSIAAVDKPADEDAYDDEETKWLFLQVAGGRPSGVPGARVCQPASVKDIIFFATSNTYSGDGTHFPEPALKHPGGDDVPAEQPHGPAALFHLDAFGASCFTPHEADAAWRQLVRDGFINKLQARIQCTAFQLPQVTDNYFDQFFCNETVYGHCNFIEVTGAVRLAVPPPDARARGV
jgi:hypothetical protein